MRKSRGLAIATLSFLFLAFLAAGVRGGASADLILEDVRPSIASTPAPLEVEAEAFRADAADGVLSAEPATPSVNRIAPTPEIMAVEEALLTESSAAPPQTSETSEEIVASETLGSVVTRPVNPAMSEEPAADEPAGITLGNVAETVRTGIDENDGASLEELNPQPQEQAPISSPNLSAAPDSPFVAGTRPSSVGTPFQNPPTSTTTQAPATTTTTTTTTTAPTTTTTATATTYNAEVFEAIIETEIFRLTNCARTGDYTNWCNEGDETGWNVSLEERPATTLIRDRSFDTSAKEWSEEVITHDTLSHSPLSAIEYSENTAQYGRPLEQHVTNEAQARSHAALFMQLWMSSAKHRSTLLSPRWQVVGVGVELISSPNGRGVWIDAVGTQQFL